MSHIHEKMDFTVCVYIVFESKVLMHKHKKLNIWLPPGGHIDPGEDPNEAALREAKEESGLDIELVGDGRAYPGSPQDARDLIPPRFLNRHYYDASRTHEHVNLIFFARAGSADARHEIDGMEIRWFTREELSDKVYAIVPDVQHHARTALDEIGEL